MTVIISVEILGISEVVIKPVIFRFSKTDIHPFKSRPSI